MARSNKIIGVESHAHRFPCTAFALIYVRVLRGRAQQQVADDRRREEKLRGKEGKGNDCAIS
jgi:hypothetical protein